MDSVDRLTFVELIELEVAKLSARGRGLWQRLELHIETSAPEEATDETLPPPDPERVEIASLIASLPLKEQGILERLMELVVGLRRSDYAEAQGQPSEPSRNRAVILAAILKDQQERRQVDPDRSPAQAVERPRAPG